MSEWGNPAEQTSVTVYWIHRYTEGTRGTETSKYPEEEKETSISWVAASERERGQTELLAVRGCGPPQRDWGYASGIDLESSTEEGNSPVREAEDTQVAPE